MSKNDHAIKQKSFKGNYVDKKIVSNLKKVIIQRESFDLELNLRQDPFMLKIFYLSVNSIAQLNQG
jgi:hypothetical protein